MFYHYTISALAFQSTPLPLDKGRAHFPAFLYLRMYFLSGMTERVPFGEKANVCEAKENRKERSSEESSETTRIINFLRMAKAETQNHSLRYALELSIETIEGKENQQVLELKDAVSELAAENEEQAKRCDQLEIELSYLYNKQAQ
jgi:Domain of unknown function (DUF5101)